MKRKVTLLIVMLLLVTSLSACVPRVRNVVVTNYPSEYLMKRLAGNRVNVTRLDQGSVAQLASVKSDYAKIIKEADVLFYINELQPYWELYKEDLSKANVHLVDLAERSALYQFKRFTKVSSGEESTILEGEYYPGIGRDSVDMYLMDPFLWSDPLAMTSMARTMLDWLIQTYPDDKAIFEANFTALEIEMVRLQADFQLLQNVPQPLKLVTMTPSFGNWQRSYGIHIYPVGLSKFGVLPNESQLNIIRERIIQDGVGYIVHEEGMPEEYEALFNQLKVELELEVIELSNLYTLSDKDIEASADYITKMYKNLETLEALFK